MKATKYKGKNYRSATQACIVKLKNTKKSQSQIAHELGITPQTVFAIKKKYNLRNS